MNKIQKGRAGLLGISIASLIIGLGGIAGAAVMIVLNANKLADKSVDVALGVILIIVGVLIGCLAIALTIFGIYYLWIALSLKATKGSLAEDNSAAKGTANMRKCANCGAEVGENDTFCPVCGKDVSGKVVCPKCGCTNVAGTAYCTSCGEKLD